MQFTARRTAPLSELLHDLMPEASNQRIKKMMRYATLLVDGKPLANPSLEVKEGSKVEIVKEGIANPKHRPPHPVLYEDNQLIIVEKPAGMLTVNQSKTPETSLYKAVFDWMRSKTGGKQRPYIVHRLDREVGGLLVFAKTEEVQELLKENWKLVEKRYYALVHGVPAKATDSIHTWLLEDDKQRVQVLKDFSEGAKEAITHYRLIEQWEGYSLLEIELETGRKNQIRVHLNHIGCPIVGDWRYGAPKVEDQFIHLLAYQLRLPHPYNSKAIEAELKLPREFLKVTGKK